MIHLLSGFGFSGVTWLLVSGSVVFNIPSSKLTLQWKSTFSNRKYIFKWWIFNCYVSLPGGGSTMFQYDSIISTSSRKGESSKTETFLVFPLSRRDEVWSLAGFTVETPKESALQSVEVEHQALLWLQRLIYKSYNDLECLKMSPSKTSSNISRWKKTYAEPLALENTHHWNCYPT